MILAVFNGVDLLAAAAVVGLAFIVFFRLQMEERRERDRELRDWLSGGRR